MYVQVKKLPLLNLKLKLNKSKYNCQNLNKSKHYKDG